MTISPTRTGIAVAAVGLLAAGAWLTGRIMTGTTTAATDYDLAAACVAPADNPAKVEVRLRWVMKSGWLPDGGFNLYRVEGQGTPVKLNSQPLGANPGHLPPGADVWKARPQVGVDKPQFQSSYADAVQTVRANPDKVPAAVFSGTSKVRLSSAVSTDAFKALREQRLALHAPPKEGVEAEKNTTLPGVRTQPPKAGVGAKSHPQAVAPPGPALLKYEEYLGPKPTVIPAVAQRAAVEHPAVMLRSQLVIGALLHPTTIGADLGLAFTDTTAETGKTYRYVLKTVAKAGGAETVVAQKDVTVKAEPPPAKPTGLAALQYDATTVCLRWDRPAHSEKIGLVSFDVYRADGTAPGPGKKLNPSPILISDIQMTRAVGLATHLEPMVFFHDATAGVVAPGTVRYTLVAVDTFGRRSESATTQLTLEDWKAPLPVRHVAAERSKGGQVKIIWTTSDDPDVVYTVYRKDTESGAGVKLAQTSGNPLSKLDVLFPELAEIVHPTPPKLHGPVIGRATAKPVTWVEWSDTPPADHYFTYAVTAIYTTHPRPSPAQTTAVVAVPSPVAPASPTVTAEFVPAAKLPPPAKPAASGQSQTILMPRNVRSTRPADLAGAVRLSWSAVPGAATYRVYRASGTGFRPIKAGQPGPADQDVTLPDQSRVRFHAEVPATEGEFTYVGQATDTTTFDDYVNKSQAHVYWYRVVAVSRWGYPAVGTVLPASAVPVKVRVPGTLSPSTPDLMSADPDYAGTVTLSLRPAPPRDGTATYHVFRTEAAGLVNVLTIQYKEIFSDKGRRDGDRVVIVDKTVKPGMHYGYYVVADNGETVPVFSTQSRRVFTSTFPGELAAPTGVQAVNKSDGVHVEWKPVAGAAGYVVERAQGGPTGTFVQISKQQTEASFTDPTPGPGPTVTYRVIAVGADGTASDPNGYPREANEKDPAKYPGLKSVTLTKS